MLTALIALAPGGDLSDWHTPGDPFPPLHDRLGLPEAFGAAAVLLVGLAAVGLWQAPKDAGLALGALFAALLVTVAYMRLRDGTQLFYLRALSILGPLTLAFAGAGIAWLIRARSRRRVPGLVAAALALGPGGLRVGAAGALHRSLRRPRHLAGARLGPSGCRPGSSVRVDVRPFGAQQWAGYMLSPTPHRDRPAAQVLPLSAGGAQSRLPAHQPLLPAPDSVGGPSSPTVASPSTASARHSGGRPLVDRAGRPAGARGTATSD